MGVILLKASVHQERRQVSTYYFQSKFSYSISLFLCIWPKSHLLIFLIFISYFSLQRPQTESSRDCFQGLLRGKKTHITQMDKQILPAVLTEWLHLSFPGVMLCSERAGWVMQSLSGFSFLRKIRKIPPGNRSVHGSAILTLECV